MGIGVKIFISIFLSFFLLAGASMCYFLLVRPVLGIISAQSWVETSCTVLASEVDVSRSSDSGGDTYRPLISYEYSIKDQRYTSNRYNFSTGYSSGYDSKKRVVDSYPPGYKTSCYVNPDDPADVVLNRSFSTDLLWGLFSLPFLLMGIGGLYFIWKPKRQARSPQSEGLGSQALLSSRPDYSSVTTDPDYKPTFGTIELKPRATPLGKFIGITLIGLFWNGITGVFVYKVVQDWIHGTAQGCLTIFLIPFVAVGLGLIYGAVHQFLAIFNPRPILRITPGHITPGDSVDVEWTFSGTASRLSKLQIRIKGEEQATYRRGTDIKTDKSVFQEIEITNTTEAFQIKQGRARIRIPENTMHSFESAHNKIVWSVLVNGDIPNWPDIEEEFAITVFPQTSRFR